MELGVLSLPEWPFVDAARSIGASPWHIMLAHICPTLWPHLSSKSHAVSSASGCVRGCGRRRRARDPAAGGVGVPGNQEYRWLPWAASPYLV